MNMDPGQTTDIAKMPEEGNQTPFLRVIGSDALERGEIEKKFLESEERYRSLVLAEQRVSVQYAVSCILVDATSLDDAIQRILQVIGEGWGWEVGAFWSIEQGANMLCCNATWHTSSITASEFETASRQISFPQGIGLPGSVWASGEPIWVPNIPDDGNYPRLKIARGEGLHGGFAFPVRGGAGILGVIEFFSCEIRPPDNDLLRTVITIGNQIGQFTERKRLEEKLHQAVHGAAEQGGRLQAIFEAMADGVLVFDREGHLLQMNTAGRELLGHEVQQKSSLHSLSEYPSLYAVRDEHGKLLAQEQWPLVRVLKGEVLKDATAVDVLVQTHDGREAQLNVSGTPVHDEEGHIDGAVIVVRDVTERRQLERRTREALDGLLKIAEVLVKVPEGTDNAKDAEDDSSLSCPPGVFSEESAVGRQLAELTRSILGCQRVSITAVDPETKGSRSVAVIGLPPELENQWRARRPGFHLSEMFSADTTLSSRLLANEVLTLDMTQPPFRDWVNPFGIQSMLLAPMCVGDQLVGLLSLDCGGTKHEYSKDELALAGAIAKLAALVIERDRLLQERERARANELALQETNRRMNEFLGIASHELRSPLTTIKGNIQLVERRLKSMLNNKGGSTGDLVEDAQNLLERAERQVALLNRLVGDLVDISRIQANKLELQMQTEPCDLAAILKEVVQEQRKVHPKRTLRLKMSSRGPVPVIADADRIGQVVTNYLSNALKYSTADQSVEVQLRVNGQMARVSVSDKGPGLSPEEQKRIWERFYQVEGIEARSGSSVGLGLGLHISRMITEQHQGEVGVQSEQGKGSTFWFTLPLASGTEK